MQPEEEDVLRDSRRRPRSKDPSSQVGGGRHGPASPRPSLEPAEGTVRRGVAARLRRLCEATSVRPQAGSSERPPGPRELGQPPGEGGGCPWETAPGHRFQVAFVFLLEAVLLADLCPALAVGFGRPKGAPPGVTEPRESGRPGGGRVGRVRSRGRWGRRGGRRGEAPGRGRVQQLGATVPRTTVLAQRPQRGAASREGVPRVPREGSAAVESTEMGLPGETPESGWALRPWLASRPAPLARCG